MNMRINYAVILLLLVIRINATAHSTDSIATDSITRALGEVVVEADKQFITEEKTVFLPTRQEKKISADGTALLQHMGIPTIYVSPIDNAIQTASGEGVTAFIDYLPATENDLANLRTMDVVRVEVFDYPKDPRFGGARHVVNFVLKKYEYGGYTKISGKQRFIDNTGNYTVASKFVYKKLTYDLSGGFNYNQSRHIGQNTETSYKFPEQEITRTETAGEGINKSRTIFAALRAIYQTPKTLISNTIGLQAVDHPDCFNSSNTIFSPEVYQSDMTQTNSDNSNFTPSWTGNYQFILPQKYTLIFNPSASYGKYRQNYDFQSKSTSIINDVEESAWAFGLDATLQKQIKSHSLSLFVSGGGRGNNLEYSGTTPTEVNTRNYYGVGRFAANMRFGKTWLQGNISLIYSRTTVNEYHKNEISPAYFISAGYTFNRKSNISVSAELSHWSIALSRQGDNMQFQNQIDAIQGNPDLESYPYNAVNIQYQWLPTNTFSMALFGGFYRFTDPICYLYEPLENSTTPVMVRHYANFGFFNNWKYGGVALLRLLKNKLQIRTSITGETISNHTTQRNSGNLLKFDAIAQYSFKNFWAQLTYQSKSKAINPTMQTETPHYYTLSLGWGNGNLNATFRINNLFNSDWEAYRQTIVANNYDYSAQAFSSNFHRSFEVSLSYSFSYGKKIRQSDLPQGTPSVSSAILE